MASHSLISTRVRQALTVLTTAHGYAIHATGLYLSNAFICVDSGISSVKNAIASVKSVKPPRHWRRQVLSLICHLSVV
jgi:hypothetical protein